MATKLIGKTISQYQIVEQIGKGGMAAVYKAYQPNLDRYVAFKILPEYYAHDEMFLTRFEREAKTIAKLSHPHILPIYDYGQSDNLTYIVMQYIDGGTLGKVMGRPMPMAQITDFIDQIAGALDYAHKQGVLHRDVKPNNILLEDGKRVLLTDFGLAKMIEGSTTQLTGSGVGIGTPAYMSPEQGQGQPVDARTDIYALGIILYEMTTGQVPYEAETPMATVIKHITDPLPLPRNINPNMPSQVEQVILKALAKDPENRYAEAGQVATALHQALKDVHEAAGATLSSETDDTLPPTASATWQIPPEQLPGSKEPMAQVPAGTVIPAATPPTPSQPQPPLQSPPAKRSNLPWIVLGGAFVVVILLAGLVGLFLITRLQREEATPAPIVGNLTTQPTATLYPTPTTAPSPTPTLVSPEFGTITFAQGYNKDTLEPTGAATSFNEGLTKIHAIFEYNYMTNGDTWERVWYLDDEEINRNTAQWSNDKNGVFDYFIDMGGSPLPPGNWRLELYVKGKLLSQGNFTITENQGY